jgi:hypothetical protein
MLRLASLTTALALVGCADNGDEGMTVINNTAVSGDSCSLSGDPAQPFKSHGEIFALSPAGYTLTPLISSRIRADTSGGMSMTPPDPLQRTIFLKGADVTLTLKAVSIETNGAFTVTQPDSLLGQFSVLFSGSLPPSGSVNVGFEVITAAMLRQVVQTSGVNLSTSDLQAEVLAEVEVIGDLGGDEVRSNSFNYPISVCTDCVINYLGDCPATGTRTGNPCNIYQDGVVDCCSDADGALICPAI